MKKILALIMACVLLMSLVACGNKDNNPTEDTTATIGSEVTDHEHDKETEDSESTIPSDNTEDTTATEEGTENTNPSEETTVPDGDSDSGNDNQSDETTPKGETPAGTEPEETTKPTEKPTEPKEEPTEPPKGHTHSYTSTVTAPTCEKGGQTTHKCSCGDSYVTDKTNATGHKWGEWVTTEESTVTKNGTAERKCSACSKTETKKLDKLPVFHSHSYTSKVVAPTCTSEGYTIHTCSCGDSYTDAKTAKTAHNYKTTVTKPTCTTEGYTTYKCSCGDTYIGDKTGKSAHSYVDTVTQPTCTAEGYTTHKCSKCGGTVVDTKVPATGHSYSDTVTKPTCDKDGYTTHKCSKCGNSYTDNTVKATGHNYQTTSDTATCTADGKITKTCSNCGGTKTETSKAKGHGATRTETTGASCTGTGKEKTICTVCNTVISEKTVQGSGEHSWSYVSCPKAVEVEMAKGNLLNANKSKYKDHSVQMCSACGTVDWNTFKQTYSQTDAASIMLGYVNSLRESVLGTSDYNLTLDAGLVADANVRAKEIATDFGHKYSGENITNVGFTIYEHFSGWKNSPGHYATMIRADFDALGNMKYSKFGYGMYTKNGVVYGVQLFY